MQLLWEVQAEGTRGPKRALTAERIARAAIAIADTEGLAAVSMQRVAAEFGFTTMSLYRYVPNKETLVALMIDFAGEGAPDLSKVKGDWRARLEEWSRRCREMFLRHPWILAATPAKRRIMGPREVAWLDSALSALAESGLAPAEQHQAFLVLIGLVRSVAQQEVDSEGEIDHGWGAAMADLMQRHGSRYPALLNAIGAGAFEPNDADSLEFGVRCLLDGIELRVTSPARPLP